MTEMSAIDANSFAVGNAAHILPDYLFIAETWPSMSLWFLNKLLDSTSPWRNKQRLARHWIVIGDFARILHEGLEPRSWWLEWIAWMLSIVPIEATNPISSLKIAAITQILLARLLACSMSLLAHDFFAAHDGISLLVLYHLLLSISHTIIQLFIIAEEYR